MSLRGGFGITRTRVFTGNDCTYACPNNPPFLQNITLQDPSFPSPMGTGTHPRRPHWICRRWTSTTRPRPSTPIASVWNVRSETGYLALEGPAIKSGTGASRSTGTNRNPWAASTTLPISTPARTRTFTAPFTVGVIYRPLRQPGTPDGMDCSCPPGTQVGHGLFISGSYTYSHGVQEAFGTGFGNNGVQNSYNVRADTGNSSVNVGHLASFSWIYDIPFMATRQGCFPRAARGMEVQRHFHLPKLASR